MSRPNTILDEPLTSGQATAPRGAWSSGKVLLASSFLIGFALAVLYSPVLFTRSEVDTHAMNMMGASASPMSMACPRPTAVSVNVMQQTLRKLGVPSSPMEKFALTSYAATRDVSMAAQAQEEFSKLDHVSQAKLKKLSREVVVKASTLKPEEMAGITLPLGFWDPAGLSKKGNLAVFRRAELKHGRVCMLATLGIVVSEEYHPFFDNWDDAPFVSAIASHFTATSKDVFWPAFWIMAAGHEFATEFNGGRYIKKDAAGNDAPVNAGVNDRAPGDFYFDPLKLKPSDPKKWKEVQNKELNNGRLAMLASAGILAQEMVTGKKIF